MIVRPLFNPSALLLAPLLSVVATIKALLFSVQCTSIVLVVAAVVGIVVNFHHYH